MKRFFALISASILTLPLVWSCTEEQEKPIVKAQSISIEQGDLTLEEGESVNLTATVLPEDATDKTVSWSSSNDDIVMVSSNGKAKAMAIGEATVTAKAGEKSDFITITVVAKTLPVTGLSLNPSSITLKVGESQTITANVTPQDATDKNVSWESSNSDVASVNNGIVTGITPGSVTITATVNGGKTADCSVTVKANLAPSVTIGSDHISAVSAVLSGEANLETSGSSDLTMGIMVSMNSGVLPSNSTKIEAIQIEAKDGFEASYSYDVDATGLEPETTYYYRSYVTQNGQDSYGETKSFTTKDLASLLTTREATSVTATSATLNGTADLSDVSVAYKTIEYGFYWGASESDQSTKLSGGDITDNAFSASLTNLSHKTQYWYKAYVKLDSQYFYGDVKTFITDVVPVESVYLNKTEYTFHTIGNTLTLTATVLPSDATDAGVKWTSTDANVATVSQSGKVTAVGNGTATITVTTIDQGKIATCEIVVAQYVTGISLSDSLLLLEIGDGATLSVTDIGPDNANDKSYTWSSSDSAIASVDNSGKVLAKARGNATIKAIANDGSGVFASCSVEVYKIDVPQAVDMGTVVNEKSIKWASFNIGASSPDEYGLYYAWGETEPKTYYDWSNYKWCSGSDRSLTKYNTNSSYGTVDNKTELVLEDEVAHVKLGGKWRMPTDAEWIALRTQCTWTWTTQNEVYGYLVTATNGNSIFLPAAGYRHDTSLDYAGTYGCYWLPSLYYYANDPAGASNVIFNSDDVSIFYSRRYFGFSVRPVYEE